MERKEKGGGEERKVTPQSAAAASSPYTGEPRTTLLSLLWETCYPYTGESRGILSDSRRDLGLGQMVVRDQKITQPALHDGRGIADQDIVGRGNVQTLDLGLRPMRDFLLQTDAAMQDQRNIEQILLLHSPRRLCGQEGRTWAAEARGGVQNQRERIPAD